MRTLRITGILIFLFSILTLKSQPDIKLTQQMQLAGYENIRAKQVGNTIYISFEDRTDKQPWDGLIRLIELCKQHQIEEMLNVNLETGGVARMNMEYDTKGILNISGATKNCEKILAHTKGLDRPYGKLLITALPVVHLRNSRTDVLFTVNAGIAPTLQMELWKGGRIDAQIIFPIYNSMEEQFDYIRPGIIAFSQRFKLGNSWQAIGSVGNFTNQRAGTHLQICYDQPAGWWGLSGEGGITGSSTTWQGKWSFSEWKKIDFRLSGYFYLPVWNTKLEVGAGRFVEGDYGIRGDLSRRFRNVTINLYAMIADSEINGGFSFIVPLTFTRIKRIRPVSLVWPQWHDWEYSAQSGPDYVNKGLGQSYLSRIYQRADESYWNPHYIKSQIIQYFNTEKE